MTHEFMDYWFTSLESELRRGASTMTALLTATGELAAFYELKHSPVASAATSAVAAGLEPACKPGDDEPPKMGSGPCPFCGAAVSRRTKYSCLLECGTLDEDADLGTDGSPQQSECCRRRAPKPPPKIIVGSTLEARLLQSQIDRIRELVNSSGKHVHVDDIREIIGDPL